MIKPQISVVMPNFNNGRFLTESVSSVLGQDYDNFELIVVDDGSTDDSFDILHSKFPNIRIVSHPQNMGVNSARNSGIRASEAQLIALCDSDDVWLPRKLSKQIELLQTAKDTTLVYSNIEYFDSNNNITLVARGKKRGNLGNIYKIHPSVGWAIGAGSTSLFFREDAIRIGLFDENLTGSGEDWEFFARLAQIGNFDFVDEVLVRVRIHPNSRSRINLRTWYKDNQVALYSSLKKDLRWTILERILSRINFEKNFLKACIERKSFNSILWRLFRSTKN